MDWEDNGLKDIFSYKKNQWRNGTPTCSYLSLCNILGTRIVWVKKKKKKKNKKRKKKKTVTGPLLPEYKGEGGGGK